jgi:4a-hydroxytetrahydrobiopterin dehydratase
VSITVAEIGAARQYGCMAGLLNDTQVTEALQHLPDWRQSGTALTRTVEFASFPQAIQALNRVAEIAESENHHPDMDVRWRSVTFLCSTHSEGGVTAADVSLAEEIDGVVDALK